LIAIPVGCGLLIEIFRWIRFIRRRCVHLHDINHKLGVDTRTKGHSPRSGKRTRVEALGENPKENEDFTTKVAKGTKLRN